MSMVDQINLHDQNTFADFTVSNNAFSAYRNLQLDHAVSNIHDVGGLRRELA